MLMLSSDRSQEPSRKEGLEELVQMNFFILGGNFGVEFLL